MVHINMGMYKHNMCGNLLVFLFPVEFTGLHEHTMVHMYICTYIYHMYAQCMYVCALVLPLGRCYLTTCKVTS